jgi:hypothetical protein
MSLNMNAAVNIRANVDGLQQIEGLRKGLGGVEGQAGRTGGALSRLKSAGGAAMNALRVIAPAASVAGVAAMAKKTLDAADALSKMSNRTGVAVPILDKFRQAAELSDTSLDAVEKGLTRLANPTTKASAALGEMGIALVDASGKMRSTDDVMLDVAKRFQEMENGPEKARLATEIFGRSLGTELIPMLNMGRDAIESLQTAFTQSFADRAAAFNDQITMMQQKFGALAAEITIAMLPALEILASALTKALDAFLSMPKELQALIGVVAALAAAFALLAPVLVPLLGILKGIAVLKIGAIIAGWAGAIGPIIGVLLTLGKVLLAVFTGPVGWVALAVAAGVAIFKFRDQIGDAFKVIGDIFKAAAEGFYKIFIEPIVERAKILYDGLVRIFTQLSTALRAPFEAAANLVRGIVNQMLNGIGQAIQAVINAINNLIQGANRGLAALKIGAIIAGWVASIGEIIGVLGTLGKILLGVFTGPVGWVALAVAAGVAIFKFRDQIGDAFKVIGDIFKKAAEGFYKIFVEPIIKRGQFVFDGLVRIFNRLAEALRAPFLAAANLVRGIVNQMLNGIGNAINAVVRAINNLIQGANRGLAALNLPQIPFVPQVPIPQFADGGMVSGPTLAMVGEGGEPEYIVPQSKASGFAANWMAGRRGAAAIPRFAEGGVVVPATSINIQTGPVLQQDGQRYVTINDLEGAMQTVVSTILGNGRTAGGRRFAGVR